MNIWVDADACPAVIRDILFRAAQRTGAPLTLVANRPLRIPPGSHAELLLVGAGFDQADQAIVQRVGAGDLVVSSDIPLAAEVIAKGAHVLSPRGEVYDADNIRARLTLRDFMDTLRGSGIHSGGPAALSQADRKAFADRLDRFLTAGAGRG